MPRNTHEESFDTERPPRPASVAMRIAAVSAIVFGIVLALVGASIMSTAAADVSHMLSVGETERRPWILLIGVAVLAAGIAGLWPAFRKRD